MFGLGFTEIMVILGVVLLVVGPEKMPELARTLGKGMFQLRKAADEFKEEVQLTKLDMPRNPLGEEIAEIKSFAAIGIADDCPESEDVASQETTSQEVTSIEDGAQKIEAAEKAEDTSESTEANETETQDSPKAGS